MLKISKTSALRKGGALGDPGFPPIEKYQKQVPHGKVIFKKRKFRNLIIGIKVFLFEKT